MAAPRNVFKDRLRSQQLGLFATLNSPALAELLAGCGFDWILIDTEHSPGEMADVVAQLRALQGREISAIVRPAWSDMVLIKRLLDAGAHWTIWKPSRRYGARCRSPGHDRRGGRTVHRPQRSGGLHGVPR